MGCSGFAAVVVVVVDYDGEIVRGQGGKNGRRDGLDCQAAPPRPGPSQMSSDETLDGRRWDVLGGKGVWRGGRVRKWRVFQGSASRSVCQAGKVEYDTGCTWWGSACPTGARYSGQSRWLFLTGASGTAPSALGVVARRRLGSHHQRETAQALGARLCPGLEPLG
jgi:hypothetical protein